MLSDALVLWIEEILGVSVQTLLLNHDAYELPALAQEYELRAEIKRFESLRDRAMEGWQLKQASADRAATKLTPRACRERRENWQWLLSEDSQ